MTKLTYFLLALSLLSLGNLKAQDDVYPAPAYKGLLFLKNATVHVGNGKVLENATIKVSNGRIEAIAPNLPIPAGDVKVFDAAGKHVYPGLILPNSTLGLIEVNSVRATADFRELGELNPNIRSIVAYNTDSKVINTLKTNGILFANVTPEGGLISGSSSVVQLDAWNWEDAVYRMDGGIHFRMPSLISRGGRGGRGRQVPVSDPMERIEAVKGFFRQAKAWYGASSHESANLKFNAVKGLFEKKQKLFIHCNIVKEMLLAADFKKEFGFDVVIVGGSESFLIAELLKQLDIPVILAQSHALPTMEDDDVDQPYKTAVALQKAGVLYAIGDEDGQTRGRNLPFNAGTAAAYGLSKEEALQAITLNPARILGIDSLTGSIEVGKDANFVVSEGDILDMRSSKILMAFIQGRYIDLTDKHKQLNERYRKKYGL